MGSQIVVGSALKIVATERWYVKTCQLRQACPHGNTALKLLQVEMVKEFNIGEEFNLGSSWARVHAGLEVGRKCLGRKMMRVDSRLRLRSTRLTWDGTVLYRFLSTNGFEN
jgi:hypothetical protein